MPVVADAPRVSRCKLFDQTSNQQRCTRYDKAACLLLVCCSGKALGEQVYFATNFSAQSSTRRCIEAMQESNENDCKIPQKF